MHDIIKYEQIGKLFIHSNVMTSELRMIGSTEIL